MGRKDRVDRRDDLMIGMDQPTCRRSQRRARCAHCNRLSHVRRTQPVGACKPAAGEAITHATVPRMPRVARMVYCPPESPKAGTWRSSRPRPESGLRRRRLAGGDLKIPHAPCLRAFDHRFGADRAPEVHFVSICGDQRHLSAIFAPPSNELLGRIITSSDRRAFRNRDQIVVEPGARMWR